MIDIRRSIFSRDTIERAASTGNTQYSPDAIWNAVKAYNAAETEYQTVVNEISAIVHPFRAPLFGLVVDTPETVKALWNALNSWDEPLENGNPSYGAREFFPVGKWNRSTSKYRAEIKRLRKLIAEAK